MAKTTRMASGAGRLAEQLPLGRDAQSVRRRLEAMEQLLERSITIPGTNQKFGLDAVLGLVPIAGDIITAAMGFYMIWEARNLKLPAHALARMAGNVAFDWALGLIPGIGDAADFFFKSNTRNLRIIKRHLDKHHPSTATIHQ